MIEMNVTQKNVAHVFRREAGFSKIDNHVVEGRFRAGVEQCDPIVRLKRARGNDTGATELARVENVNLHA
jgi:hypothetical protein